MSRMAVDITIEEALLKVGGFGKFQALLSLILVLSSYSAGIITFQFQSLAILPDISCVSNRCKALLHEQSLSQSEVICMVRKSEWVYSNPFKNNWAKQFELYCEDVYLISLGTTVYFIGFFFGVMVLSSFCDKYGRRVSTLIFLFGYCFILICVKFSTILDQIMILRALCGVLHSGVSISAYVMTCEFLHTKYAVIASLISSIAFSLGGSTAGYLALINNRWQNCLDLPLLISAINLLLLYFFCPETPFWLFAKGKELQAIVSLNEVAKLNRCKALKEVHLISASKPSPSGKTRSEQSSAKLLLFTPFLRTAMLKLSVAWFTVAICYYALEFNAGALGTNEYYVMIIMGCTDFPFKLFIIVLAKRYGRQKALQWYFTVCAAMLITSAVPFMAFTYLYRSFSLKTIFVIIGRSLGGANFALLYTYTSEVLPTLSRSTGKAFSFFLTFDELEFWKILRPLQNQIILLPYLFKHYFCRNVFLFSLC